MSKQVIFLTCSLLLLSVNLQAESFEKKLVAAAHERTMHQVRYDGSYRAIDYPNGDVPGDVGVCTDVLIRSYRELDIALQKWVHADIARNLDEYPSKRIWGLKRPDKNIDHRRVPNLQTFFTRHGETLKISHDPKDYSPGDIVTWMLPNNRPHIGIVSSKKSQMSGAPLVVHNIGAGPQLEDRLFAYKITGHYKFVPPAVVSANHNK